MAQSTAELGTNCPQAAAGSLLPTRWPLWADAMLISQPGPCQPLRLQRGQRLPVLVHLSAPQKACHWPCYVTGQPTVPLSLGKWGTVTGRREWNNHFCSADSLLSKEGLETRCMNPKPCKHRSAPRVHMGGVSPGY